MAPILKNERNLKKFPQCIADDIKRQVHELSTSVYQIRGHIKGKTLLPFPQVNEQYSTVRFNSELCLATSFDEKRIMSPSVFLGQEPRKFYLNPLCLFRNTSMYSDVQEVPIFVELLDMAKILTLS